MSDINGGKFSGRISKMSAREVSSSSSADGKITIVNLNLAVNRYDRKSKQEQPMFIKVKVVGKQAEALAKNMGVGDQLFIDGVWEPNDWENTKTGDKHHELVLVADNIVYGRKKGDRTGSAADVNNAAAATPPKTNNSNNGFYPIDDTEEDDDLPF